MVELASILCTVSGRSSWQPAVCTVHETGSGDAGVTPKFLICDSDYKTSTVCVTQYVTPRHLSRLILVLCSQTPPLFISTCGEKGLVKLHTSTDARHTTTTFQLVQCN